MPCNKMHKSCYVNKGRYRTEYSLLLSNKRSHIDHTGKIGLQRTCNEFRRKRDVLSSNNSSEMHDASKPSRMTDYVSETEIS